MTQPVDTAHAPGRGDLVAFAAALLSCVLLLGGLAPAGVSALVIAAVVAAVSAAYSAADERWAAVAAGAGGLIGAFLAAAYATPAFARQAFGLVSPLVIAALAAGLAYAVRRAADAGVVRERAAVAVGVLLIVGSLWVTTAVLVPTQVVLDGQTVSQFLDTRPAAGVKQVDQVFYNAVRLKMRDGEPYYAAFREAYHENAIWASDPPSILSVREPLLPVVLAALPGDGRSVIWLMALLASVACVAAVYAVPNAEQLSVRLVGAAAVAAYYLYFTTMPFVLGFEAWGGALALICAALVASALTVADDRRSLALHVAAALVAVLAVAVRELMLFLPAAGILSALFLPKAQRGRVLAVWSGAAIASFAVLGLHAAAASQIVTHARDAAAWLSMRGGLPNVIAGLRHGTRFMSSSEIVVLLLGALGLIGAALQPNRSYRAFLITSVVLPFALFLMSWNGAIDELTRKPVNYWGAIIAPLVFALVPGALGALDRSGARLIGRREAA